MYNVNIKESFNRVDEILKCSSTIEQYFPVVQPLGFVTVFVFKILQVPTVVAMQLPWLRKAYVTQYPYMVHLKFFFLFK